MNSQPLSLQPRTGRESTFQRVRRCVEQGFIPVPARPKFVPNPKDGAGEDRPCMVSIADFAANWKISPREMYNILSDNGIKVFTSGAKRMVIESVASAALLAVAQQRVTAP